MTAAACDSCGRKRIRVGDGLCADCYRDKYGESLWMDDQRRRLKCTAAEGCDRFSVQHGLCQKHFMRMYRHGSTAQTRPADWGRRTSHPLYKMWEKLCRRYKTVVCEAWRNDFWSFLDSVGERPTDRHTIFRLKATKPFEPGNVKWRAPKTPQGYSSTDRKAKNAYMRAWNAADPERAKSIYLERHYGIDLAAYNAMYERQNGLCAICQHPEHVLDKRTNRPRMLAVDHDHVTNEIRALLCTNCNKGIGHFHDSVDLMRAAIAYLERHAAPTCEAVAVDTTPAPS